MRLHGGDIEIESELGKGTTVRINLPEACLARSGADLETVCPA